MKPTHIDIIGRSKFLYNAEVARELAYGRFSHVIERLPGGETIVLRQSLKSADEIQDLIAFLVRRGIPRNDIRVRYPESDRSDQLHLALAKGLYASGLSFGLDVAERDEGLARYFISTASFKAVQSHQKHIIVGPKGSGKSAILRELSTESENSLVITPEHYATEILESLKKGASIDDVTAYAATWKYTLLVEVFKKIVSHQIGDSKSIEEIRAYLVSRGHLSKEQSLFERFTNHLRRIKNLKVGPVEIGADSDSASELNKLYRMDELLELIPSLQRALRRKRFAIFIDELDQSWNNSETANGFLVSLLIAAIDLRGMSENIHVVVFLRSEIFDLLISHLAQLDKMRSDIETLSWSPKELTKLVVSRALDALRLNFDVQAETAIRIIFQGSVDGYSVSLFEYLLSRTSMRPREVIQFCNLALRISADSGNSAIDAASVLQAEEEFSSWKKEYIASENMYIHPGIGSLLEKFRGKSRILSKRELDDIMVDAILGAQNDKKPMPGWCRIDMEPSELIQILYDLEVIGIERSSGMDLRNRNMWLNYDFVFTRPKGKPEDSNTYIFHPGLWRSLDIQ